MTCLNAGKSAPCSRAASQAGYATVVRALLKVGLAAAQEIVMRQTMPSRRYFFMPQILSKHALRIAAALMYQVPAQLRDSQTPLLDPAHWSRSYFPLCPDQWSGDSLSCFRRRRDYFNGLNINAATPPNAVPVLIARPRFEAANGRCRASNLSLSYSRFAVAERGDGHAWPFIVAASKRGRSACPPVHAALAAVPRRNSRQS